MIEHRESATASQTAAAHETASGADRRIMTLIVDEIATWSKHPGRKLGAVITGTGGGFRALGFNGLPRGMDDQDERYRVNPLKSEFTICAERNALRNARMVGTDVTGAWLHVCWCPCEKCAIAIVESGIARVYAVASDMETAHPRWGMSRSLDILREGGVQLVWHDPDDPRYRSLMARLPDTPAVPSHTTDWDRRFMRMARHVAGWQPGGMGEVLVQRPLTPDAEDDKIVRALGCLTARTGGALENAARIDLDPAGATLYVSDLPSPAGFEARLAGLELGALAVAVDQLESRSGAAWLDATKTLRESLGLRMTAIRGSVETAHPAACFRGAVPLVE